jgi:hypothetical protein
MPSPKPGSRGLYLRLQGCGEDSCLAAVLVTPQGAVDLPPIPIPLDQLRTLLERWQRTLRWHYIVNDPAVPGQHAVQGTAFDLVSALDHFWRQPGWLPLHHALEQNPGLPLRLEIPPPPGATPQPSHPLALAEQLPWEHLLQRQQPIWRVRSITASPQPQLARQPSRPKWRRPRLLLLIGPSQGLDLKPQIQALNTLKRAGRLELVTLGDQPNAADAALKRLRADPQGWDGVIYLGHGDPSPAGGGGLKLEAGGLLAGEDLADALRQASPQLVLLSRCHGTDLVPLCLAAGVPWVLAFRGEVPDPIALAGFAPTWQALAAGGSQVEARAAARDALEKHYPGSSPLLNLVGRWDADPLRLPLRRRQLWRQRLVHSQKRQLVATALVLGIGLLAYGPKWGATEPVPSFLLNTRLDAQKAWRDLRRMPSLSLAIPKPSPLVVWLLSRDLAYPKGSDRVSHQVLADVLRALKPDKAPVVGIDVVVDGEAQSATKALAALIKQQQRKELFVIYMPEATERHGYKGDHSRPKGDLKGLPSFSASLGIFQSHDEFPLQLQNAVGRETFAWALAQAQGGSPPHDGLPAGSVIDWSVDWFDPSLIRIVPISTRQPTAADTLPLGARVLVGVDTRSAERGTVASGGASPTQGAQDQDLYLVPDALLTQESEGSATDDLKNFLNAGNERKLPGALLQAVWAESLRRGHWLTPLRPLPTMALAAGLGVLLAAALERRRSRLLALTLLSALAGLGALELALAVQLLVPLFFPLLALWAACLSRQET